MKKALILGICGGSAAGKSRLAEEVNRELEIPALILSQDAYYADIGPLSPQERLGINFDHPDAIDHKLLIQHLDALKKREPIKVPVYDFESCCRTGSRMIHEIPPVVILEGLFLFCIPEILVRLDYKVAIDASEEERIRRILVRDLATRGRTEATVRENLRRYVLPMHNQFIHPFHNKADWIVHNDVDDEEQLRTQATQLIRKFTLNCRLEAPSSK